MNQAQQKEILRRWLGAESSRSEEEAEEQLGLLLRTLPSYAPRSGFAKRVLAAVGRQDWKVSMPLGSPVPALWLRVALGMALTVAGLSLPLAREGLWQVGRWVGLADLTAGLARGLVSFLQSFDLLLAVFAFLAVLRDGLMTLVSSPPIATALLAMVLLSTLAYRWLTVILMSSRSRSYV